MKDKILLVLAGGTIGGEINGNSISTSEKNRYLILDLYNQNKEYMKDVEFDTISPVNILSENATAGDWTVIADSIKAKDLAEYKGVIITYGTDTLGYFANALSYLLYKVEIPVMIVASNFVLTDKKANGFENFKVAIDFIVEKGTKGVYVPYKNYSGEMYLHQGTKVKQIAQLSGSVYSIHDDWYARIINGNITRRSYYKPCIELDKDYDFKLSDKVLYIKPTIGTNYDIDVENYKIIFHETFHTGAIPEHALNLVRKCKQKNVLFFMGTLYYEYSTLYAPTKEAFEEGAIILHDMSHEAILAKLMVAAGTFNTNEEIKEFMSKNILGEILD